MHGLISCACIFVTEVFSMVTISLDTRMTQESEVATVTDVLSV